MCFCVGMYTCVQVPPRPEKDAASPGARILGSRKPLTYRY